MIKKILIVSTVVLAALAVVSLIALNIFSRKAPAYLRAAIEKSLDKPVSIGDIEYHFPDLFYLRDFQIGEDAPFAGDSSFTVEEIELRVSPASLSKKGLVIESVKVESAAIGIRKLEGELFHAFSNAAPDSGAGESVAADLQEGEGQAARTLPLEIRHFSLKNSVFKFIDYDVQENGFVVTLDRIEADIRDIVLPFSASETTYSVKARLLQGREQRPATFSLSGWTQFGTRDTDASITAEEVYLPYFRPYYGQVTDALIQEGILDARGVLRIAQKELAFDIDFGIRGLLFDSYEAENQLFGLKAEEILSFLKDSSGRLQFQVSLRWNIADRSVKARDVIRRAVERSLKATVLGNVSRALTNVLKKIGEDGPDAAGQTAKDAVQKIKDFLKY